MAPAKTVKKYIVADGRPFVFGVGDPDDPIVYHADPGTVLYEPWLENAGSGLGIPRMVTLGLVVEAGTHPAKKVPASPGQEFKRDGNHVFVKPLNEDDADTVDAAQTRVGQAEAELADAQAHLDELVAAEEAAKAAEAGAAESEQTNGDDEQTVVASEATAGDVASAGSESDDGSATGDEGGTGDVGAASPAAAPEG